MKGKGVGTAGRAVAKDATLHVDLLRAFPAEDGSILLHPNGARPDAQLLEPAFLTQLLSSENQELLNRPAKGFSMLAGSIIHGAVALQRSDQSWRKQVKVKEGKKGKAKGKALQVLMWPQNQ